MTESNEQGLPPVTPGAWARTVERLRAQNAPAAHEAAKIAFTLIDSVPEGRGDFQDVLSYAQAFQEEVGVPVTNIPASSIHLMSKENMARVQGLLGNSSDLHGLYEPITGLSYVQNEGFEVPRLERIGTVIHEIGHKLTPGLDLSSHLLKEATAEKFGRFFIRGFRGYRMPEEEVKIQDVFGPEGVVSDQEILDEHGFPIKEEDIFYVLTDTDGQSGTYARFPYSLEVRTLGEIENRLGPDATLEYWRRCMTAGSNPEGFVIDQLGEDQFIAIKRWAAGLDRDY